MATEAATRFYGRPLSALTDDRSLVAMPYAPDAMNPTRHPAENAERVRRIKRLLAHACAPSGRLDVELKACAV